jgi:hypothetical protein
MKFHLLPVGEKFSYQGEVYVKAGPLTASAEQTGTNRLIPRSANVQPVNNQESATPKVVEDHQVQTARVLREFDVFHQHCLQCLKEIADKPDPEIIKNKTDEVEAAARDFIDKLVS